MYCKKDKITLQNMHSFCRTCLKELKINKVSIHDSENIEEIIKFCSSKSIETYAMLPEYVCRKCYKKLQSFQEFRCKTQQSDCVLSNIMKECNWSNSSDGEIQNDINEQNIDQLVPKIKMECSLDPVNNNNKVLVFDDVQTEVEIDMNSIDMHATYSENTVKLLEDNDALNNFESSSELYYIQNEENKLMGSDLPLSDVEDKNDDTVLYNLFTKIKSKRPLDKKSKEKSGNSGSGGSVKFQCDQCPRRFFTCENYEAHLRIHKGLKPYECKECGSNFSRADHWRTHVREIHAPTALEFNCSFKGCDKIFKRESSLRVHYRIKHKYEARPVKNYMCEDCGRSFTNATTFKHHRYKHIPVEQYPFKCDECGKQFTSKRTFKEHQLRHAGVKNFVCPHCGMKKTTKNELRTHINYHTKEKQWPCSKCTVVFNSSANLGLHDRIVHKGIRRYSCKYCDQSFGKPDTLKHHEMRHTGEKPHGCDICGKRFIQAVALRTHLKVHNKETAK